MCTMKTEYPSASQAEANIHCFVRVRPTTPTHLMLGSRRRRIIAEWESLHNQFWNNVKLHWMKRNNDVLLFA